MVVIDEELVSICLWKMEEQIEGDEPNRVAAFKASGPPEVDFASVEELRMSYESIFTIDNLEGFSQLRVLSLDNNCIKKMCNLEPLVNLEWLDLSFNRIERIEGLETLTKLTDLSLCNNKISKIENLRDCQKLKILSLGNNNIAQLDQVKVLRGLPELQVLNLAGNPMGKDSEYRNFCLAYLKHLRYFDYALLTETEVTAAKEQFQDFLAEVEEKEMLEDKAHEFAQQQSRTMKDVVDAHLLPVENLVQAIFKDDPEIGKLKLLPFFDELLADYEDKYATELETFKAAALEIHFTMVKEHKKVTNTLNKLWSEDTKSSIELVQAFKDRFVEEKDQVRQDPHSQASIDIVAGLQEANAALQDSLMLIEANAQEIFSNVMRIFEIAYGGHKGKRLELQTEFFRKTEELETTFAETLANKALELAANGADPANEDLAILLQDKEALKSTLGSSNDMHVGKLIATEDSMRDNFVKTITHTIASINAEEKDRNRNRVLEVTNFYSQTKQELDQLDEIAHQ